MKVELFKKIIKEAVKEVLQEELRGILSEVAKRQQDIPSTKPTIFQEYRKIPSTETPEVRTNPLMEILNQTRQSMTKEDYSHLVGNSLTQQPPTIVDNISENKTPQVGLDLTNLGFIKNAGAILKASNEKDKQRIGG